MSGEQVLEKAVRLLGLMPTAKAAGCSYQNVQKWLRRGRLPRTEYTGETFYAEAIAAACREKDPDTDITREALLGIAAQRVA